MTDFRTVRYDKFASKAWPTVPLPVLQLRYRIYPKLCFLVVKVQKFMWKKKIFFSKGFCLECAMCYDFSENDIFFAISVRYLFGMRATYMLCSSVFPKIGESVKP